ncbi:glycerophosphodiester phosphodiesterase [Opitutia bacterium ISCC 51]|nr:glycerophosphodiester phosphodiesterase [Opitutae bacterium ISCC 51]QXD29946.1 glycerophosphodiester phosphodiesterase [Opitutae bacterium ISCC 52]
MSRYFLLILLMSCLDSVGKNEDLAIAVGNLTQIIAHRGASAERPECMITATKRAIEVGATATEVDLRTSKDGKLFILHDATLAGLQMGRVRQTS